MSAAFSSARGATSIIPHLLPGLYISTPSPHPNCLATILVSLIHHLVSTYPSQSLFQQYLGDIPPSLLPRKSDASKWINALSRSLRTHNFIKFEELTRLSNITPFLDPQRKLSSSSESTPSYHGVADLPRQALYEIIESLRVKARSTSWDIIRSAYREVSSGSETGDWLARSLFLKSFRPYGPTVGAEQWLEQQSPLGHVRPKEGIINRWIIYKVR